MKSKTKKIKLRDEIKVFTQGVSCVMGVGGRRGRRHQRAHFRKLEKAGIVLAPNGVGGRTMEFATKLERAREAEAQMKVLNKRFGKNGALAKPLSKKAR